LGRLGNRSQKLGSLRLAKKHCPVSAPAVISRPNLTDRTQSAASVAPQTVPLSRSAWRPPVEGRTPLGWLRIQRSGGALLCPTGQRLSRHVRRRVHSARALAGLQPNACAAQSSLVARCRLPGLIQRRARGRRPPRRLTCCEAGRCESEAAVIERRGHFRVGRNPRSCQRSAAAAARRAAVHR
jgi:hypothetical protein